MRKRILILVLSIFMSTCFGFSDGKELSVEDIINTENVSDLQISPDGKFVVWVQSKANKDKDKHLSYLWIASLEKLEEPIQLTKGDYSSWSPRFSPDGKKLAFLSDRAENTQIFIINPSGGESEKLTDAKMGVDSFAWKDNETIVFSAREDEYLFEKERKEKKDDAEVFEDLETFFPIRLFSISLKDKKVLRLTENKDRITFFSISPDGRLVVTTHIDTPRFEVEAKYRPKYFLWDLKDQKKKFLKKSFFPLPFTNGLMIQKNFILLRKKQDLRKKERVE